MESAGGYTLLLGASGFLGSACLRHALEAGDRAGGLLHRSPLPRDLTPDPLLRGNLLTFPWQRLEEDPPRVILHFARIAAPGRLRRLAAALSARANRRLLNWLERQDQPPRLVLVAGTLAYGASPDEELFEDHPLAPAGFARQYALGEAPIIAAMAAQKTPILIARPAWVYGPRSWLRSFYFLPMQRDGRVPLYGEGENWMALIHVEDAARLIYALGTEGATGESYNLFAGTPIRQAELAGLLSRISGLPVSRKSAGDLAAKDPGLWESLTFSQRTATRHAGLYRRIGFRHPEPGAALESLWRAFLSS
jgi:nucleoside-diphosphate-sugar epimerase